MEVMMMMCGFNSFNQLNINSVDENRTKIEKDQKSTNVITRMSILKPIKQYTVNSNRDVSVEFTWSKVFTSIKTDDGKWMTTVQGSTLQTLEGDMMCLANTQDDSCTVLSENKSDISCDGLLLFHEDLSQPEAVCITSGFDGEDGIKKPVKIHHIAGGHKDFYAVYDGVSFGQFEYPRNFPKSSQLQQDSDEQRHHSLSISIRYIDVVPPIKQISCGKEHVLLLTMSGNVYSQGLSSRGQLGHGEIDSESSPRLVEALEGVRMVSVAAGGWHSVALSEIGDVYVWGWNESGQLGLKTQCKDSQSNETRDGDENMGIVATPTCIDMPNGENVKEVSCGSRHTVVLTDAGEVFTCGWNGYGQLGLGDTNHREKLTKIDDVIACKVFAGHWNTVLYSQ